MKALDIGCGIGRITEYLSDVTRVNLTGIDIAAKAIEQAIERTANKQYRLTFEVQNIDNIKFPTNSFDSIISFDSLYFAYDLNATINRLKEIIKTGGTMGFTYSQKINPDEPTDNLLPYKTKLALALCNENLNYTYIDYSDEEYEFWKRSKSIAEELKSDFEKEGFPDLYESRISESEVMLEAIDQDRLRRFHYYVNC